MQVIRYQSPADFLSVTEVLRSAEIVRTNLISSIANSVANGFRVYEAYYWWAVKERNKTLGIAIRTAPYGYVISPMSQEVTMALLAQITVIDSKADEFSGPKSVINIIENNLRLKPEKIESELIYKLTTLNDIALQGVVRVAAKEDYELVLDWMNAFMEETGITFYDLENVINTALMRGAYCFLEIDSSPVSMGGSSAVIEVLGQKIGRVGPIWTPKEFRKHGYASSITYHLTQKLLAEGATPALYTQAENPTSNKIYQNLGYELVDEIRRIKFRCA